MCSGNVFARVTWVEIPTDDVKGSWRDEAGRWLWVGQCRNEIQTAAAADASGSTAFDEETEPSSGRCRRRGQSAAAAAAAAGGLGRRRRPALRRRLRRVRGARRGRRQHVRTAAPARVPPEQSEDPATAHPRRRRRGGAPSPATIAQSGAAATPQRRADWFADDHRRRFVTEPQDPTAGTVRPDPAAAATTTGHSSATHCYSAGKRFHTSARCAYLSTSDAEEGWTKGRRSRGLGLESAWPLKICRRIWITLQVWHHQGWKICVKNGR